MSEPADYSLLIEAIRKGRERVRQRVTVPDSVTSEQLCMIDYLRGLGLYPFQVMEILPLIDPRHIQERYQVLEELMLRGIETLNKEAPEERA
jgi:hypothetical protein